MPSVSELALEECNGQTGFGQTLQKAEHFIFSSQILPCILQAAHMHS